MTINYSALLSRVVELLTNPRQTWNIIRGESDHGKDLILRYVFLLALVPTALGFLGKILFGEGLLYSLVYSVLLLGVFVGSVFVLGLLVDTMAPSFGTTRSEDAAFKLVAYVSTPVWVAGFLTVVPELTTLAMLAGFGYAVYLFHIGCQAIMDTPGDKALKFSLAAVGTWFLIVLITALVVSRIAALLFAPTLLRTQLPRSPKNPIGF